MPRVYRPSPRSTAAPRARRARAGGDRGRARVVEHRGVRELRIDGTYASHYEPGSEVTGSVWDALAAGLLALPPARRSRVLLLGLGGGSAARIVRAIAPRARIVGVEIDPQVVKLARRWFALDEIGVETQVADAAEFLRRTRRRFDAVIEDVFVGEEDELRKPSGFPEPALERATSLLRPGGVIVSNTLDETAAVRRVLARRLPRLLEIGVRGYDNRILVAGPRALSGRLLRDAVRSNTVLGPSARRMRFRTVR